MAAIGRLGAKGARPAVLVLAGDPSFRPGSVAFAVSDRPAVFIAPDRPSAFVAPDRPSTFTVPA